ncbi:MAG: dTDP-4-dehydrorhamnose 3,5-epimerase [Bacteroidales bacterium]|nr:dTDP-4-dehydrorhamnose 3,5-epimerase [Bacteroidales bacterium]
MKVTETGIPGLKLIEPRIFEDARGYFFESYSEQKMSEAGLDIRFVQDNQSKSTRGVIRGLHYQMAPKAQTKLIRVLQGTIYDVAVDIRRGSPTFGQWFGQELSDENKLQLLIPKGFAHGFSVLSGEAIILYKCDEFYAPEYDAGIRFDDPELGIDWKVPIEEAILSGKDSALPVMRASINNFKFEG